MVEERKITLKQGETHAIQLRSNPSTGYSWQFKAHNPEIAHINDDGYKADAHPPGHVGGGGQRHFTIVANQPGTADITLSYERGAGPDKLKYIVTVN